MKLTQMLMMISTSLNSYQSVCTTITNKLGASTDKDNNGILMNFLINKNQPPFIIYTSDQIFSDPAGTLGCQITSCSM